MGSDDGRSSVKVQYTREVLDLIDIINEVLQELGKPKIFENCDITVDKTSFDALLILHFNKQNRRSLYMVVSAVDVEILVERLVEFFWWSYDEVKKDRTEMKASLTMLLTSMVREEQYGSNYTEMYFYDDKGECVYMLDQATCLLPRFLLKRFKHKTVLYEPFYEMPVSS